MRSINKDILKLALPSILANITVPLVGMVDIAVAGHLDTSAAVMIGGIAIGSMLFDLLYWNFGFLRVGTGGLAAQAYGRGDRKECARIFARAVGIALACAFVLIAVQWLFVKAAFLVVDCTPEVRELASRYFFIRIWAAPATLSLMAFKGWFIGMQDSVLRNTEGMLKLIIGYVFNIELIGAILLTGAFLLENRFSFWECVYYGIFHSIAGFCNAGFSPFNDSLQSFGPAVKIIVAFLIISGGIGVYVIYDLVQTRRRVGMLKIHTRLVMISSVILIVLGTGLIKLFEYLEGNAPIAWIDAFFMSVSARTAGYVTVPLSELSPNSISMIIIFMMIGAAPGSTGGGMKVTVVGVAVLAIINTFLGNRRVLLFRREIAMDNILKSFTIIVTFVLLVAGAAAVLSPMLSHTEQAVWFEAASALSTTGMSMDVTSALPVAAKMLVITLMFIGRIGPFTIFLFLLDRERVSRISYPEERIIIG